MDSIRSNRRGRAISFCCGLVVLFGALAVLSAAPTGREIFSANRRYSVDLSQDTEGMLIVGVSEHLKDSRTLLWSRKLEWRKAFPQQMHFDAHSHVTSDGSTVVLRDRHHPDQLNGVQIVRRDLENPIKLNTLSNTNLTGAEETPERRFPRGRPGVVFMGVPALIDFLIDEERTYAIWFGQTDRWVTISLDDSASTILKPGRRLDDLNQRARAWAEKRVTEHQPGSLRKAIQTIHAEIGKLIPGMGQSKKPAYNQDALTAYLFLAARKKPSDRAYLERLLHFPTSRGFSHAHIGNRAFDGKGLEFYLWGRTERVLADFLLSQWDGATNESHFIYKTYLSIPDEPLRRLGAARVQIRTAIPMTNDCGNIWIYLIPAKLPPGVWAGNDEVTFHQVFLSSAGGPITSTERAEAMFKALTPGDYRVKLIWERNPTPGASSADGFYKALPGDYESAESQPFQVKPGETTTGISVACTNQITPSKALSPK